MCARACLLVLLAGLSTGAWAQPESRGPHAIADYSAGRVSLAGANIPVRVFHPSDAAARGPVVAVVHGFLRNGSYMAEMARTLASRGMVALVPDMPCGAGGCDHAANALQIRALIAWGISEGARSGSAIAGRVDPVRRGVIGHSWGALATLLASAQPDGFDVAVLLDPNDDAGVGAMAASSVDKPTLLLQAEVLGNCNSAWGTGVFSTIPEPHLRVRVRGAAHCDAEEPSDALCPIGCGRGDPAKSAIFRRYAVAFVACALQGDRAVAPWVGGAALAMDDADGVVDMVSAGGLSALGCLGGPEPPPDAGPVVGDDARPAGDDAGPIVSDDARPAGEDAGPIASEDAQAVGADAGAASADDAATTASTDAAARADAAPGLTPIADGCQSVRGGDTAWLLAVLGLAIARLAPRRES